MTLKLVGKPSPRREREMAALVVKDRAVASTASQKHRPVQFLPGRWSHGRRPILRFSARRSEYLELALACEPT